jgi:hypothetical protein
MDWLKHDWTLSQRGMESSRTPDLRMIKPNGQAEGSHWGELPLTAGLRLNSCRFERARQVGEDITPLQGLLKRGRLL